MAQRAKTQIAPKATSQSKVAKQAGRKFQAPKKKASAALPASKSVGKTSATKGSKASVSQLSPAQSSSSQKPAQSRSRMKRRG